MFSKWLLIPIWENFQCSACIGDAQKDAQLFVGDNKRPFKVTHLYQLQGKDTVEVDALLPGDIGAVAKLDELILIVCYMIHMTKILFI